MYDLFHLFDWLWNTNIVIVPRVTILDILFKLNFYFEYSVLCLQDHKAFTADREYRDTGRLKIQVYMLCSLFGVTTVVSF